MEKTKKNKILKGLGIGALACLGMFTFAGCSIDLTQEQMDKVMYTVDNADTFMNETLDLLNKQNAELDKEEAWDLYNLATTKYALNYNGIRDNIKLSYQYADEFGSGYLLGLQLDDTYVFLQKDQVEYILFYEDNGYVYSYRDRGDTTEKTLVGEGTVIENLPGENIFLSTMLEVQKEQIAACDKLENGNYKITFLAKDEVIGDLSGALTFIVEVEMTTDGNIVSEKGQYMSIGEDSKYIIPKMSVNVEYGVVTEADVADMLAEAKAAELTDAE